MGVPVGVHWYSWHRIPFDDDYPHHFPVKEGFAEGVRELQEAGVFVMPYINGRLWDTRDKGSEEDPPGGIKGEVGRLASRPSASLGMAVPLSSLRVRRSWPEQGDPEGGSVAPVQLNGAIELFDEQRHQLQAQGLSLSKVQVTGEADSVVTDNKSVLALGASGDLHHDLAVPTFGEGVSQRVRDKLVHYETAGYGHVYIQTSLFHTDAGSDGTQAAIVGLEQAG
ncbi:unnamed protein product [marine sediment metagenome]|uniref:DUF6259 domain-containing protein n=1 Tax=marine sediment metagenome TaxID=412755 RepID=X1L066_9ZZZZ